MSNECKSDFFPIFPNFSCIFSGIFGVFSVFGCIVILQQLGRLVSVARMSGEGAGIVWEPPFQAAVLRILLGLPQLCSGWWQLNWGA